jgi:hypothetical protein
MDLDYGFIVRGVAGEVTLTGPDDTSKVRDEKIF